MSNNKDRCLIFVLTNLKKHIPDDEEDFYNSISKILNTVSFTAPEAMTDHWFTVQDIISKKFKKYSKLEDIPEWGQRVINIWTNKI